MRGHTIAEEGDCSSYGGTGSEGQLGRWAIKKNKVTSSVVAGSKEESIQCAKSRYTSVNEG